MTVANKPKFPNAARVSAYARAVVAGRIEAGRLVGLACQRHMDDLKHGHLRGLVWVPARAESVITFAESLNLDQDVPLVLDDYECFILGSVIGWCLKLAKGETARRRRFTTVFMEIAKSNGKTPMGAVLCLYGMHLDPEPAPECYSAAHKKEIAQICFRAAKRMVASTPELKAVILPQVGSLSIPANHAVMRPLSSEDNSLDGPIVHVGVVDELQEHRDGMVVLKMQAATKGRKSPLIVILCNSGHNRQSAVWHYHEVTQKILQGTIRNDDFFGYVAHLDACPACHAKGNLLPDPKCRHCDDWRERKVWKKANPGLGTICPAAYLEKQVRIATTMPSERNGILRLNFSLWTETASGWVNMHAWNQACAAPALSLEAYAGRPCWLAMDAANKVDITALVAVFERAPGSGKLELAALGEAARQALDASRPASATEGEDPANVRNTNIEVEPARALSAAGYVCFARCFIPRAMVNNSTGANVELYGQWAAQKLPSLIITDGARTDFDRIEEELKWWNGKFSVQRLAFDPREMSYLIQRVQVWAGFECVEVTQSPAMMSQPMKELEALILSGLMRHDGDPVLSWMLGNVEQNTARGGGPVKYYFPRRGADSKKIDAAVALIMALDSALRAPENSGPSVYETRGLLRG